MDNNKIQFILEGGKVIDGKIILTHEHNGKKYLIFEDLETGNVTAATYIEEKNGEGRVFEIETDEEWAMIDEVLDAYYDENDLEEVDEDLQ